MKKLTLIAMSISAFIALTTNSTLAQAAKDVKPAEEGKAKKPAHEGSEGHSHFTKIPATVEDIWKKIHEQQGKLISVVTQKDLGEAHDHAFAIRDLVKALPAKVPAENKSKAEEGAKEITKIAADIDKSSAAKAQKATEAKVKKMGEAILALQTKLQPNEVKK